MPDILHLPPVAQGVIAITAVALAVARLLTASRPFWAWEKVPVWLQKLLPALLMAVAALPTAIENARSWLDIVVGFVVTGAMWFTASRGDKRPPEDKGGGPRIERTNSDPRLTRDELAPPPPSIRPEGGMDAECSVLPWWAFVELQLARRRLYLYAVGPAAMLVFAIAALSVLACDPRKPPCDESKLRQVDKAFVARVSSVCLAKYDVAEECPEYPALKANHRRELREVCPQ